MAKTVFMPILPLLPKKLAENIKPLLFETSKTSAKEQHEEVECRLQLLLLSLR
jgi:hypothetical protein